MYAIFAYIYHHLLTNQPNVGKISHALILCSSLSMNGFRLPSVLKEDSPLPLSNLSEGATVSVLLRHLGFDFFGDFLQIVPW